MAQPPHGFTVPQRESVGNFVMGHPPRSSTGNEQDATLRTGDFTTNMPSGGIPLTYEYGPTSANVPTDTYFTRFGQVFPSTCYQQPPPVSQDQHDMQNGPRTTSVYPSMPVFYPPFIPVAWPAAQSYQTHPQLSSSPAPQSVRNPPQRKKNGSRSLSGLTTEEQTRASELGLSVECVHQVLSVGRTALRIPVTLSGSRSYPLLIFYYPSGQTPPLGLQAIAVQTDEINGYTIVQCPYAMAVGWLARLPNVKIDSICLV